jgi:hypothetical protein
MKSYEIGITPFGEEYILFTDEDGKVYSIPKDPSNSDYQRYLNPEAEQSTPNLAP